MMTMGRTLREKIHLVALQSTLDVSREFGDGAGSSGADCLMGVATEESSTQKRVASLPLRGPSPKNPCTATNGGQDSLRVAPVAPSLMGPEAPV